MGIGAEIVVLVGEGEIGMDGSSGLNGSIEDGRSARATLAGMPPDLDVYQSIKNLETPFGRPDSRVVVLNVVLERMRVRMHRR